MRTPQSSHHDVVVVGARCAGAVTAMLLARAGHDVVVVDRAPFPSNVVSTHGISRGGVVQLSRWGLLDAALGDGAPPVREVTFGSVGTLTTRRVKHQAGVDLLVAPRRDRLDALLVAAAEAAGARVFTGVTARGVTRDRAGRVTGLRVRDTDRRPVQLGARYVVAADGLRSRLVRELGARTLEWYAGDTAMLYMYVDGVRWSGHELHVGPDAFAGVFPTHHGEACVWLSRPEAVMRTLRAPARRRAEALTSELAEVAPELADRVRSGRVTERVRGAARLPSYVRQAVGPGWALVGDAGYHRDPITGHGITDAFRDAELLAVALDRSLRDPSEQWHAMAEFAYHRDAALREVFDLTRALASFPAPHDFVGLQRQLSDALEHEADFLASLPELTPAAAPAA